LVHDVSGRQISEVIPCCRHNENAKFIQRVHRIGTLVKMGGANSICGPANGGARSLKL